jgi:hypothetical protein
VFSSSLRHEKEGKTEKGEREREKFQFFEPFVLRVVVARVSRRMREYRFLFNVSV